ncbi:MAG: hypothetical protein M0R70_10930 [Nitrospirae bacterium]|nr:hypothetical protein [Nitrospirota bacterium]
MKTHKKITALAGFGLVLIMIIVGLSLRNAISAFSAFTAGTEQASLKIGQVEAMAQELEVMSANTHEFTASRNNKFREANDVSRAAVHRMLDAFNAQAVDPGDRRLSRLLQASFISLEKTADRLFSLKDPVGRDRVSARNLAIETSGLAASMHQDIDVYRKGKSDAQITKLSDHFRSMKTRLVLLFFTILLTSAVFLLVFAIFLHRTVSVPLSRLLDGARELRQGNPDHRKQLQGTNDIAQLAAHMNGLVDKLKCLTTEEQQSHDKYVKTALALRHEINNPLTTIIGNVELLIERYEHKDKDLTARLEAVLNNALRIAEITKRLQEIKKETSVDDRTSSNITDSTEKNRQP